MNRLWFPRGVTAVIAIASAITGCALASRASSRVTNVILSSRDVATGGSGSPYYRIPALAISNHGTVLAAFDARPTLSDLPSNIRIVVLRSTDNGHSFGMQIVVRSDSAPYGFGDPSFIVDRQTGRIFLFYAAGAYEGYAGSHIGAGADDPNILQADYSYSDDDGLTWRYRRITGLIKNPEWGGMFASSGAGIQIRHGRYAGRLVQQYTVRYRNANWAASAYSDDHGTTWHMGQLVGPGADENKSVELSDGTLMLNVRAKPYRKIAHSINGGETWFGLHDDSQLADPGNNGSIIRYAVDATPGSTEAHWLLFSNTASTTERRNLTLKMSCDDGRTWPMSNPVDTGPSAYSTLARLRDGNFVLLYERGEYKYITLVTFSPSWLASPCAGYPAR